MNLARRLAPALPLATLPARAAAADPPRVHSPSIVMLSTMLSDADIGEWGFGALVKVDRERILFDTGARPNTVLENAREPKVELAGIARGGPGPQPLGPAGGLMTLRRELGPAHPESLSRAHVGRGIFGSRPEADGRTAEAQKRLEEWRSIDPTTGRNHQDT